MRDEIKRRETPKDRMIDDIIDIEWNMFDKVNNAGGRAACQDDWWTFYAMRFSQFSSFPENVLASYRQDLEEAKNAGRNLLTEKYAYMMEFTEPDYFDSVLKKNLPPVSPIKEEMVDRIANILIGCEQEFVRRYPGLGSKSRPVVGTGGGDVSFHVYTIGELKTYSERTLSLMSSYLSGLDPSSELENPSCVIHAATVGFYGYESLDSAEAAIVRS